MPATTIRPPDDIYEIGTLARVLQLLKLPDGTVKVLVEGVGARQRHGLHRRRRLSIEAEAVGARRGRRREGRGRGAGALGRQRVRELCEAQQEDLARGASAPFGRSTSPRKLADTVASHLAVKIADKQEVLEITHVAERLEKVLSLMESEISVLQVEKRIRSRVKRQMEKTQREYYLNEQMKAIQKELGDGEEGRDELAELEEKIEKTKLSKEARDKAHRELKKLRQMSPMSAEATVVRNYLDWMLVDPVGQEVARSRRT